MQINAHSIQSGDDIEFTYDGKQVSGMVTTNPTRIGPNMLFEMWHSVKGSSDYCLDMYDEVRLISDTDRTYA